MNILLPSKLAKDGYEGEEHGLQLAAMGLEAEFTVTADGALSTPEAVFGTPSQVVRKGTVKRAGRSVQLPTGCALYFDTGVIELATPVIEISQQSAAQAGRVLWQSIDFLRDQIDKWEKVEKRQIRLGGFSTHYNISFDIIDDERRQKRSVVDLAYLLTHILPWAVMLLAANKDSTGIGVRPRGKRIEVTADFTPDPQLMIAAAALITGVVREVMTWRSFELSELTKRGLPIVDGFKPIKHDSRKGWVAKKSCFERNPFQAPVGQDIWLVGGQRQSSLDMAGAVWRYFGDSIKTHSDLASQELMSKIFRGEQKALIEEDRPRGYDDVGRECAWNNCYLDGDLPRSVYEQLVQHALKQELIVIRGEVYQAVGLRGWSRIRLKRLSDGSRHLASLDFLRREAQVL